MAADKTKEEVTPNEIIEGAEEAQTEKSPAELLAEEQTKANKRKQERDMYMQRLQARMSAVQTLMPDAEDDFKKQLEDLAAEINLENHQEQIKDVISSNISKVNRLKSAKEQDELAISNAQKELEINEKILQYVVGDEEKGEAYGKYHDEANALMLEHLEKFPGFTK
jgi:hypothetical protein